MDFASRRATVGALGYRDEISKGTTAHLSVPSGGMGTEYKEDPCGRGSRDTG